MKQQIFLKNWSRKLIFVFLLLIAGPVVRVILGSNNFDDIGYWGIMFMPGMSVALIYLITSFLFWLFLKKETKIYLCLDIAILLISLIVLFSPIPNLYCELFRHNDEIDAEIRNNIHSLNEKIIESIKNNDPTIMYNLFVNEVKDKDIVNVENLYSQFAPAIDGKEFELYNEYYIVSHNWRPVQLVVPSGTIADSEFCMRVSAPSNNTYISLLKSEGEFKDFVFSLVYVKVNNEWRLNIAHLGIMNIGGKTVLQWFQEAKQLSIKGYKVPALLRLSVVNQILHPAPFIQYTKEKEIIALTSETQATIDKRHKFPIRLSSIPNEPEIYYIEPQFVQMDLIPMIKYVTKIPLDNISELQKEVNSMTTEMESIFPGITKDVSHIAYKAFSEHPTDPKKTYTCYVLTVRINLQEYF